MKDDPLADVPPGEFVRARNALVKELRAAGRSAEARSLAARRRPSPSSWAVNQLARRQPRLVADLVSAGKALAGAQRALLKGGNIDRMRDAEGALRAALSAVEQELGELSGPALRRAAETLRAAATADDATRAALRAGRLERDLDPATGFDALGATPLPARRRDAAAKARLPDRRAREKAARDEARAAAAERKAAARDAKLRARRARELERLRAAALAAERRARELRARADEAAAGHGA